MALTRATAQTHLDAWMAADLAVASGQSYSIEGRSLTRADATEITAKIQYWSRVVADFDRRAAGLATVRAKSGVFC